MKYMRVISEISNQILEPENLYFIKFPEPFGSLVYALHFE